VSVTSLASKSTPEKSSATRMIWPLCHQSLTVCSASSGVGAFSSDSWTVTVRRRVSVIVTWYTRPVGCVWCSCFFFMVSTSFFYHPKGGHAARRSPGFSFWVVSLSFAVPPCAVAIHVLKEEVPRCFEFFPDKSQPEHPAPESVGFILRLLGLGACEADLLGQLAHGQAELDHRLEVPCVEPVLLAVSRGDELYKSEFDRMFRECRVSVQIV